MKPTAPTLLIAVVGGSGAGKTWFTERLCRALGENACRLSLDDFYRDRSHLPMARRARLNFDVPSAIDWVEAERTLEDCRNGLPTRLPRYDFATHCRGEKCRLWLPRPVAFVDGLWLLREPQIRRLFDLSIYLDTPTNLRHARRLARDTVERGYTADAVEQRLTQMVHPMHHRYVEPQKRLANVVLAQPLREAEVLPLADQLWDLLSAHGVLPTWSQEAFRTELLSLLVNHEYCT